MPGRALLAYTYSGEDSVIEAERYSDWAGVRVVCTSDDAESDLRLHSTSLQVPSEHKYSPVSQGSMMLIVRITEAFRLGME